MKRTIAIIIMAIIILGLGGYIAYDKLYTKELKPEETKEEKKEEIKEVEEKVDVVDGYTYEATVPATEKGCQSPEPTEVEYDVKLPKITGNKENAEKLNKEIEDFYKEEMNNYVEKNRSFNVSYKYIIKNNLLVINITEGAGNPCGTGYYHVTDYYYDIKNDKILNSEEAFTKAGYTVEDLTDTKYRDVPEGALAKDFESCDKQNKNGCGCGLVIDGNNLLPHNNNGQCL